MCGMIEWHKQTVRLGIGQSNGPASAQSGESAPFIFAKTSWEPFYLHADNGKLISQRFVVFLLRAAERAHSGFIIGSGT